MAAVKSSTKTSYVCRECGSEFPKWSGQCMECRAWNTIEEQLLSKTADPRSASGYAGVATTEVVTLDHVSGESEVRYPSASDELDRVLGGGLVAGAVVLIGGDPGIGKSTLLIQTLAKLEVDPAPLYVSGEESPQQISLRAQRLSLPRDRLHCLAETCIERILAITAQRRPQVIVLDSIQTMYTEMLGSAPGSVSQVRESAARIVRYAKQTGTTVLLVGHVTKEGSLAGPRVLEHMVDTVLYFEGEAGSQFRLIRTIKNRFGAVNELGVFAMTEAGLKAVTNPSAIFLSRPEEPTPGSAILVTREGTRPLMVEVQALVDESPLANPRRIAVGLEQNRMSMLLAVLHRHGGVAMFDQDVFVNVVGGVRISETAADLAVVLAILSSHRSNPLPNDLAVFGEVGLTGEIRPVQNGEDRVQEAAKHGFKRIILPRANKVKKNLTGVELTQVGRLSEALEVI